MSVTTASFYITGGTLQRDAACYVERQADSALYDGLVQGKFCYVLTSRQMGKSSLMVHTATRLREEGVAVAVLDLTAIGQNLNPEQWYNGLISQMGQRLDLEDELDDFSYEHKDLGPLQRWLRAIHQIVLPRYSGRVVIFVDEIDAVRSLPFSTDEFFAAIREFYNSRTENPELERLTFCLLGVATPSDLIRDTRTTPFNIGHRVELNDFTVSEAAQLAKGLGREKEVAEALLKRVLYWTGGHPYLTQRLCQAIAEDKSVSSAEGVDRLCDELFFSHRAQEKDDNLLFVRERMLRSEVDLAGLLELYKRAHRGKRVLDDETSQLVSILRLSGIARVENGCLKVRNKIYSRVFDREWIAVNMPDAELRRQRAAYRRGLLRATAISVMILAVIAGLLFFAIKQRNRAEQGELEKGRLLYAAQMNPAYQAWEGSNVGRAVELLEDQQPKPGQEDLRGFEWYYLWRLCHSELLTFQHNDYVTSVAFSPDGKILASGSQDKTAKLWDVATGRELATLKGHTERVWTVVFSPDGKMLASGSHDKTVKLWDIATGQELKTLSSPDWVYSLAFSPDGRMLAAGTGTTISGNGEGTIKLWDVATRQELATLRGHTNQISSLAFSPDGKTLATGSGRNMLKSSSPEPATLKLWDLATGEELTTLKGHLDQIFSLAFSPDSKILATGSADKTVKL